ncbi:ATP-dependent exonuclase V beta subunit, helicase and exonuclease domain-containing [Belliella baltica DSM 15883]|uniref:DNA 3'-5' helicase n=1 Tax=Belliella baltica (strain DSM 15883 / CIP 108006 / LMG 21964 / BA134) TaxID=866536 RepID=I3Z9U0_BELBD|nr:UvrD-helicase domain-containing protein [Belliella baltica]AFL86008.1 ATP-dependent exonuclase V beta subunit, helicase and exonuclease domain-containing [Belliella baltica DSM 15883]
MADRPFIIYKSSAGSGKTYTLTMEYLKLALKNPENFRSILAVTFTNKATQEMKERIIKELKRLKIDVKPNEKMDSEIMAALGLSVEELQLRASQTLTAILHDFSRFSVNTIDSFFQKVVRAFAREMDLNAKFEVELDQDAVLEKVVDRVVMQVMDDEFLHKWLVDYAVEQIQNGKSWDIRKNIKELGRQIFQEDFKKYAPEIREFLKDKNNITELQSYIKERKTNILKIALELKNQATQIRIANGLDWTDFAGSSRSFALKFDQLGDRKYPIPSLSDLQQDLAFGEDGWFSKTSKSKDAIIASYHQGLGQILGQFRPLEIKWNTLEVIGKNIYVFGIFRNMLEELITLKDEENMLLISDANEFLKEITKENDAPFIYEKVGNQYKNYLIDEFQDTSGFQWASFKPLLENSLAQGHTNLLVGDVKQSIYRWRGGEMKLLLERVEEEMGKGNVQNNNLDTNFRSLPNIINFNNSIFKSLSKSFEETLSSSYGADDRGIISKAYQDVKQRISERKATSEFKGKVQISFLEEDKELEDDGKFDALALSKLPQMVTELQDKGYELKDIAFLVRRKSEGEAIADTLMTYGAENVDTRYSFDVLSDESMFLFKAASVKALVAGLKYLNNPEDQVQFKTMWYYRSVLASKEVNHELFALDKIPEHMKQKVNKFVKNEMLLLQLPLIEAVEELIEILDLQSFGLERAYISGFKEAIYDFTTNNRADLSGFLAWWDENQSKRTVKIPDGHNAMRILTIHKSKGLQFKVVIMPFLKWDIFDTRKSNVVWAPFEDREKQLEAIIPLTMNSTLAKSDFADIYAEEAVMAYLDSLNMIYVALTRAEDVFLGIAPFKEKITSQNYLQAQLQQVLTQSKDDEGGLCLSDFYDSETKVFEFGDWPKGIEREILEKKLSDLRWSYQNWTQLLKVKKYAVDFSAEGLDQRKTQNFGLMVHEILEISKSKEDTKLNLASFYYEGRLTLEEKDEVEKQLDVLFSNSLFASWFEVDGVLLAEQGILLPGGKMKRPDRIILKQDHAMVVDFKTGEPYEKHKEQVSEYMDLVAQLTGKPASGYLCYLENGEIISVIND